MTTTFELEKILLPSLVTVATYFRIGLELGVCDADAARDWAISVINSMDEPPGEIIEVSWRKPLAYLIDDLHAVEGEADLRLVRGWLLFRLWQSMPASDTHLDVVVRRGMQLASSVVDDDLYSLFDRIDDGLQLAVSGCYGTVAGCRVELEKILMDEMAQPGI